MNILSISGILPVPGIVKDNDFLIPLFETYRKKYPDDRIYFVKPFAYKPTLKSSRLLSRIKEYDIGGFKVVLLPYFSTWSFASLHSIIASLSSYYLNRHKIRRLIKEWEIDIIHAEYVIPDGFMARMISKDLGIKYVVTVHDENRYMNYSISRKTVTSVLAGASWITPLNFPSAILYKKAVETSIEVIPHGIDIRFLKAEPEYNSGNEIKILTIAALLSYKNIDKVLMSLSRLKSNFHFSYTIVGTGPEKKRLNDLVNELGLKNRVMFIDRIPYDEIPSEMCRHDIFILPSYFETFGRVLFEAMAVGMPVICAKDSGIHGYFSEGEEAISVHHYDIEEIADKLRILMSDSDLRRIMGQKAKKLMLSYTWENIVTTLNSIYIKALMKS